jgi:hypothetical protein
MAGVSRLKIDLSVGPGLPPTQDITKGIVEQTVEISEPLRFYIDYQSMARDMELNGDIFTVEQGDQVHRPLHRTFGRTAWHRG